MPLSDLTRDAVLLALAEFDELGRGPFLAKYGFGESRSYFVVHDGKRYDSKGIAGAAHGFLPGHRPLDASQFVGGERTVKKALTKLGFVVEGPPRNPPWSRDELILALDLYFRHRPDRIGKSHAEVVKLSVLLNKLPHPTAHPDAERFRNPNGVYMKLCNFLRFDPEYHGKGLESGGKAEEDIWAEFSNDRTRLAEVASRIVDTLGATAGDAAPMREQHYWALFANPKIYQIEEALRSVVEDRWTTAGKHLRAGDRVMIWRGLGSDGRRGVVAFGEVTSDPEAYDDSGNRFWVVRPEAKREPRVRVRYVVPPRLPLWLGEHEEALSRLSVARARGGTAFKITTEEWTAVLNLAGGWPEAAVSQQPQAVGSVYTNVGRVAQSTRRNPFEVDPDKVDRGNQAHASTVDALADHLRAVGITPLKPSDGDPEFDLAWAHDDAFYVAEIKSATNDNEEKQLRLGLGQVLRYRHLLSGRAQAVVAVLVAEREPTDDSWKATCAAIGVRLTWPGAFDGAVP